ncbi:MAG TPA: nitroreductase family protein [Actinomycetota bacterium]|jgi:nitroreductase|nr:nitroreductase family protein [Actinomycetota bacterium]
MDDPGLFATLYTSRALRRFRPDPVPEDIIYQLVDAAIRAPTGHNRQDWRFVVVTDPAAKQKMQEWSERAWKMAFAEYPTTKEIDTLPRTARLSIRGVYDLAHNLAAVPLVVVVCGLKGIHSSPGGSHFPAAQNMLLAARALGLGGSIFNLPMVGGRELYELLEIPESNEIYCVIPIGYPTDKPGPLKRKPVKKVAYLEKFGTEWPFANDQPDDGWTTKWIKGGT